MTAWIQLALMSLALALAACRPAAQPADAPPAAHAAAKRSAPAANAGGTHAATTHAGAHDGHPASPTTVTMPPLPAQLWATDAPLREGMTGIAEAVAKAQAAERAGAFGRDEARVLASRIDERFSYMLVNCKLEPEADAALHALVARLITAARQLEVDPDAPGAMEQLHELLALYPRYFDHPGWNAGVVHG